MFEAIDPTPADVSARLQALGLTVEDLLVAVQAGVLARRTTTANHPRSYGGWKEYAERVAALRDALLPRGWRAVEPDGVCLTVHPDGRLAVMTALGTPGTGTYEDVTTKRSRGERTEKIVKVNAQLELALDLPAEHPQPLPPASATWVLLVHTDADTVRSELSLAKHIDGDGYIDEWIDRIPLPVIRLNDVLARVDGDDDGPNYDFEVTEK